MTRMRVPVIVLALAAMPFVAVAAQGNSETCNESQARVVAEARRSGKQVPPGLAKKCPAPQPPAPPPPPAPVPPPPPAPVPPPPPPPPPPPAPEPGIHRALGMVYEDVDGDGRRDPFAGDLGLTGWTVYLYDGAGVLLATTTSGETDPATMSNYSFNALPNGTYSVCVVSQAGYAQTAPTSGNGCGGLGYSFTFNSMIVNWASMRDFGMFPQ